MSTIKSAQDIQSIFETPQRVSNSLVVALIVPTPAGRGPEGRVVFVAGKRLGNAVVRNRCKRVLRASVRRTGICWPGYDIALVARERTATADPTALDRALLDVVGRSRVSR